MREMTGDVKQATEYISMKLRGKVFQYLSSLRTSIFLKANSEEVEACSHFLWNLDNTPTYVPSSYQKLRFNYHVNVPSCIFEDNQTEHNCS